MDPMVGSSINDGDAVSDGSDNAALLDFCFLCSRQFFHDNLDNYGTERLKDEDVLETFFEELGPVDRALLQCCPSCKALCKILTTTKEALSSLVDEITVLLLRSKKVSYLLSKSRIVNRLFQSSNLSLPPCEVSSSYLQQPLSHITFVKDISNPNSNNCFPTQFNLKLDSNNICGDDQLDLALSHSNVSSIMKKPLAFRSLTPNKNEFKQRLSSSCSSVFASLYTDSIMNSVSDNACDISEEPHMESQAYSDVEESISEISENIEKQNDLLSEITLVNDKNTHNEKFLADFQTDSGKNSVKDESFIYNTGNVNESEFNDAEDHFDNNLPEVNSVNFSDTDSDSQSDEEDQAKLEPKMPPKTCSKTNKAADKFKCDPCNKSFKNARNLKIHANWHSQERKFICELCGVGYRYKRGLDSHVALHKGEPKFQCTFCFKAFSQKIGLQRHMRIHMRKFQYVCDTCGKKFLHHTSFKAHKLVHTGEKNYHCPDCDLTFPLKSNLQRHMKVHTGEKPYSCSVCRLSFSARYNLLTHMECHDETGSAKPYKCSLCFKTYTRKFKLKQHMIQIHHASI